MFRNRDFPLCYVLRMCRQRVTPTEPCHLLDDNLLHLAVSSANDVQTLLQLADLNAVNSEELCVSSLSVDAVDAVGNVLNHESSVVDTTTVVENVVSSDNATTSVYAVPVTLKRMRYVPSSIGAVNEGSGVTLQLLLTVSPLELRPVEPLGAL